MMKIINETESQRLGIALYRNDEKCDISIAITGIISLMYFISGEFLKCVRRFA